MRRGKDDENDGRGVAEGDGRLVPLAPGRTPFVVIPRWSWRVRGQGGCARGEERTTRVPEVSGGYSVITVRADKPNQKR